MGLSVQIRKNLGKFNLDVTFETENGVTGLLGASGCGKSLTLRCIAGIMKPDEGQIVLDGVTLFDSERHINLPPQRRQVGLLFQNYALFPNMTVEQNLEAGLCREKNRAKKAEAVRAMIRKFQLDGLEKLRPSQLSGGQQQRTALARILLSRPRLLMLDEPFSALDSYLKWELELELSDHLKESAVPVLFVSHSRDEVYRLCSHVCVIADGRSQPCVTVRELFDAPKTRAAALLSGCKNYSRAVKISETRVRAVDWGQELECKRTVPDSVRSVGVRSHYFIPGAKPGKNTMVCVVLRIVDDVFSTVILAKPLQAPDSDAFCGQSRIRLDVPKEKGAAVREGEQILVGVAPTDILLLEEENGTDG